jgi:thiamine biosynthesis lipoprotein
MKTSLLIFLIVLIAACQKPPEHLIKKQYFIFGTIIEILVWHNDEVLVNTALLSVEQELNGMHSQWHAWKEGRLHEINTALRSGQSFNLTEEEARFIELTTELSNKSLGNFNPAIGQLINVWGFHTLIQEYLEKMPVMTDITIENNQITSKNQQIWLDFGGVAKGYAIDKAINILKKHGVINAIVNAGGDLRSMGLKGDKNWQVAIRKPHSEDVIAVISVQGDESIFTSGNYERYKEFKGKRYAHIINPQTGYDVEEIVSATVITDNGTADAAATALIVAGTKDWNKVALSMQLDHVLLLKADGLCFATKKMMQRLEQSDLKCALLEM